MSAAILMSVGGLADVCLPCMILYMRSVALANVFSVLLFNFGHVCAAYVACDSMIADPIMALALNVMDCLLKKGPLRGSAVAYAIAALR